MRNINHGLRIAFIFSFAGFSLPGYSGINNTTPTLSSFNLSDIAAGTLGVKQMTLAWTSASDDAGVTYSVCKKDTTQTNNCDVLTSVTDVLSATVTVDSLVQALSAGYFILAQSGDKTKASSEASLTTDTVTRMIGYFKASNTGIMDYFGYNVALSSDGNTLAVGAPYEDNTGNVAYSGAVYLFSNSSGSWTQTAYLKAPNPGTGDGFGYRVALSHDGSTLAVSAPYEGNTDATNDSGAVYLFGHSSGSWTQTAYLKASNTEADDGFGMSMALSSDGGTLAVGAPYEDNSATGVMTDGSETSDTGTAYGSGAAYLFSNSSGSWTQMAYFKASNTGADDQFGTSLALSSDGGTLAVGAPDEDNSATGVVTDGSESKDTGTAANSGAIYLFSDHRKNWAQVAYIKASNTGADDNFGASLALSSDGSTLVVGAPNEDNDATGVITDGSETSDTGTAANSGAIYLFSDHRKNWGQVAYIKASNTEADDGFGVSVALSSDGSTLAVGAPYEDNSATGVITDSTETSDTGTADSSGAVYLFSDTNSWAQIAYIKASNTGENDSFGLSVTLNNDGNTLAASAPGESNSATGVITDGPETSDTGTASFSGAVYMY
ncbi:hypothetical protein [Vibrio quintilis]|uniref:FG-GAP repeat protein n=1 Tax=Vibrio quintilis TaxID=1117707 RepID=A0A1M7YQ26_9VIBR|nr:hypothetical protein [Vibrio quintilis]SHO54733.1 hypothetical protein VQ7734_00451 [Vibrio quintilis]